MKQAYLNLQFSSQGHGYNAGSSPGLVSRLRSGGRGHHRWVDLQMNNKQKTVMQSQHRLQKNIIILHYIVPVK